MSRVPEKPPEEVNMPGTERLPKVPTEVMTVWLADRIGPTKPDDAVTRPLRAMEVPWYDELVVTPTTERLVRGPRDVIPGCDAVRRVPEKPPEVHTPVETDRQERVPTPVIAGCTGVATLPTKPPELDVIPERERPPAMVVRWSEADRYWVLL